MFFRLSSLRGFRLSSVILSFTFDLKDRYDCTDRYGVSLIKKKLFYFSLNGGWNLSAYLRCAYFEKDIIFLYGITYLYRP